MDCEFGGIDFVGRFGIQQYFALGAEAGDDPGWQGITEAKNDVIDCSFRCPMRQVRPLANGGLSVEQGKEHCGNVARVTGP